MCHGLYCVVPVAMSINITSRGKQYTFPSGTKYSVIDAFLKERLANGALIDERGVVYTDRNIKDGSYTVHLSMMANFEHEMEIFRMNSAIELRKHLEKEEAARRKHLLAMRALHEAITTRHFYDSLSMNPLSFMNNLFRIDTCLMDGKNFIIAIAYDPLQPSQYINSL